MVSTSWFIILLLHSLHHSTSGARIVRLRVYNSEYDRVFVERKVHNEKWTGDVSSKDRFPLVGSQVMQLLRGQSVDIADKHNLLKKEIQEMIAAYQLYPVLRVEYDRIAFQPKDHDHVRVSIDVNMRYLQEKTSHLDW